MQRARNARGMCVQAMEGKAYMQGAGISFRVRRKRFFIMTFVRVLVFVFVS